MDSISKKPILQPLKSDPRLAKRIVRIWIVSCLLSISCFLSSVHPAWSKEKILVLVSNVDIKKYERVRKGFMESYDIYKTINLANQWYDSGRIENLILDESPDLVFAIGSRALKMAVPVIPEKTNLIFSSVVNWRRFSVTDRIYGISNELTPLMELTLFRYFFPNLKRIGVVYGKRFNQEWFKKAHQHGLEMGFQIMGESVKKPHEVLSAVEEILPRVEALWIIPDPVVLATKKIVTHIFEKITQKNKPIFAYSAGFNQLGAALTLSVDETTIGRQASMLASIALEGEELSERVQPPAGTYITINLNKFKKSGFDPDMQALQFADKIIE